jgi:hypothetical protein
MQLPSPSVAASALFVAFLACAPGALARTVVDVQPYQGYVCVVTYSDGQSTLEYCPLDWPPANELLMVSCQCEHIDPFSDICEVTVNRWNHHYTYQYTPVGVARLAWQPDPYSNYAGFVCPRDTPPNNNTCTLTVAVHTPSGASGNALCYSN